MSSVRHVVFALVLSILPAAASAQRVASELAGIAPRVSLAPPARTDTAGVDTVGHGRARLTHALIGGGVGLLLGMWIGNEHDRGRQSRCPSGDDLCHVEGVEGAIGAVVGLIAGVVIGALWPTH